MSQSLKQIMEMNVFNTDTQQWETGAPETLSTAVYREDGTTVESALAALPGVIEDAITLLKGGVEADGDTLAKLLSKITAIQTALDSDDETLDTLQEVVDYIKTNKDALTLLGADKVDYSDIANDLTTIIEGKVLDARQGKALRDLIDGLQMAVTALETQVGSLAGMIPIVSETAPSNPVGGQIWWRPIGTVTG